MHSTPTSLMPISERHALSLKGDCKSAGKGTAATPASMLALGAWAGNKRCAPRILTHRCGGMAPVMGVLEWKDAGTAGRRGDTRRGCFPLCQWPVRMHWTSPASWLMRSWGLIGWVKGRTEIGNITVRVCCRSSNQEDWEDEALYRETGMASCSQVQIIMRNFSHPNTRWRGNTAGTTNPGGSWNALMIIPFSKWNGTGWVRLWAAFFSGSCACPWQQGWHFKVGL